MHRLKPSHSLTHLRMQEHSLDVQSPIAMKPVAFLSHKIDESSPLYGKSQQELLKERGFLVISLSAVDDQTLQTLHSRMLYHGKAIRFGHAFEVGQAFAHSRCTPFRIVMG